MASWHRPSNRWHQQGHASEDGLTCPRCGDLSPWRSLACVTCGTRLYVEANDEQREPRQLRISEHD